MATVLGLDLGSYAIKGVLFETSMRSYQMRSYADVPRQGGERFESLRQSLEDFFGKYPLRADQVVIALPGPSLATHVLTLPFTDSKRIEAALPFEVESQLPFDLSEAVFDYQVAAQQDKRSDLLVGVVKKDELRSLLTLLKDLNIDPRIVTHPAVEYQNYLLTAPQLFQPATTGSSVAVIDIGHERTSVAIGRPTFGLEFARTFAGGGKELTRAIASELQMPLPEAAHWKETQAAMGSAALGPDGARVTDILGRGLQPVFRELRTTIKAFTARSRRTVGCVYLCGGTARLPGLNEELATALSLPAEVLTLPAEAAGIAPEQHSAAAQAFGLALRGQASSSRGPRLNFRRGEFAFRAGYDYVRERVGLLASFAATLLILLIASGLVRNSVLARREAEVDNVLCTITQRVLGRCERNFDRALNLLRGKESPAAAIPKFSAVALLSELTQRVPADMPVTFDQIIVDADRISLRGETDSAKQVDAIASGLKTFRCFRNVTVGKVQKTKDGQHVSFALDVQIECPEQGQVSQG
jgi:general secretion pathway protein L